MLPHHEHLSVGYQQSHLRRPNYYDMESHGDINSILTSQMNQHSTDFEGEPLVLSLHNQANMMMPYQKFPSLLSTDFLQSSNSSNGGSPCASVDNNANSCKKSRLDLNLKEKKRMFKLNERIQQLKQTLQDAGIPSKKNKQSILDNTACYIGMLQNELNNTKQQAKVLEKLVQKAANHEENSNNPSHHHRHHNNQNNNQNNNNHPTTIDFLQWILRCASLPTALLNIDGTFAGCNSLFNHLTSYTEEELNDVRIFSNVVGNNGNDIFIKIGEMFSRDNNQMPKTFWEKCHMKHGVFSACITVNLIRDFNNSEFYQFVVIPMEEISFQLSNPSNQDDSNSTLGVKNMP